MLREIAVGPIWDPITETFTDRPKYYPLQIPYLRRIIDPYKQRKREQIKKQKQEDAITSRTAMKQQGYVSMAEMVKTSGKSSSTLYKAIADKKMEGVKVAKAWFVKQSDFEAYLSKCPPTKHKNKQGLSKEVQNKRIKALLTLVLNNKEDDHTS